MIGATRIPKRSRVQIIWSTKRRRWTMCRMVPFLPTELAVCSAAIIVLPLPHGPFQMTRLAPCWYGTRPRSSKSSCIGIKTGLSPCNSGGSSNSITLHLRETMLGNETIAAAEPAKFAVLLRIALRTDRVRQTGLQGLSGQFKSAKRFPSVFLELFDQEEMVVVGQLDCLVEPGFRRRHQVDGLDFADQVGKGSVREYVSQAVRNDVAEFVLDILASGCRILFLWTLSRFSVFSSPLRTIGSFFACLACGFFIRRFFRTSFSRGCKGFSYRCYQMIAYSALFGDPSITSFLPFLDLEKHLDSFSLVVVRPAESVRSIGASGVQQGILKRPLADIGRNFRFPRLAIAAKTMKPVRKPEILSIVVDNNVG